MYQTNKRKFLFLILIFFSFLYPFFGQQVLSNLNTSWTNVLPGSVITSPALTSYGFCLISDARLISALHTKVKLFGKNHVLVPEM